ncbi:hypothetical protein AB0H77_29500 [Streptomyces sp. NPDC050844]|uniref:hypothetical protein n=1 Tax=Streptomyces sp. NPDC050844 TaxID=3155790 RepID=UPI0033D18610
MTHIEAQARYVVKAVRAPRSARARALDVRPEAEQRFQDEVREQFGRTIWAVGGCRSWYQSDSPSGTVLWPDSTVRYRRRLRTVRRRDFRCTPLQR